MTPFYRLHSGGVVRNGAAVLLVGPNGAGKTTLVLRLVQRGVFRSLGRRSLDQIRSHDSPIRPQRPLLLKESAWDLFPHCRDKFIETGEQGCRSWWLRPEDLRPACKAEPTPVWGMVALKPASGDRPSLEEIGQTEAISYLLPESMNFPEVRDIGLSTLVNMVRCGQVVQAHERRPGRIRPDTLRSPSMKNAAADADESVNYYYYLRMIRKVERDSCISVRHSGHCSQGRRGRGDRIGPGHVLVLRGAVRRETRLQHRAGAGHRGRRGARDRGMAWRTASHSSAGIRRRPSCRRRPTC